MLVAELRVQQGSAHEGAEERGLVPTHVQMVDVDVTETSHHLHLILNCEGEEEEETHMLGEMFSGCATLGATKTFSF